MNIITILLITFYTTNTLQPNLQHKTLKSSSNTTSLRSSQNNAYSSAIILKGSSQWLIILIGVLIGITIFVYYKRHQIKLKLQWMKRLRTNVNKYMQSKDKVVQFTPTQPSDRQNYQSTDEQNMMQIGQVQQSTSNDLSDVFRKKDQKKNMKKRKALSAKIEEDQPQKQYELREEDQQFDTPQTVDQENNNQEQ